MFRLCSILFLLLSLVLCLSLQADELADPSDPVAGRSHWAYLPLSSAELPKVKNEIWSQSPIDRYTLANLEHENLTPAPRADKRTLLRRVRYALTGLPPTEQEMTEFLTDDSPEAYERIVDRLLDSSEYGQHWGRHWLDLARYADSNGLDENFLFREAWRYRNWVIDAVQSDMPFDEFIRQQIAGDLLPFESIEQRDQQRIAAGFLVVGPKVLLGNDPRERIMDVADEQLDTVGRAVLGQTLGCARCHDHKFDPIPTSDYYAMAGIMTSTKVMETRYMLGQQRTMEQLIGLGENGDTIDDAYEKYWREKSKLEAKVKEAQTALELLKKPDEVALKKHGEAHPNSVAETVLNREKPQEQRLAAQEKLVADLTEAAKPKPIPPRAMIPVDVEKPQDEAIRLSGQFNDKGDIVPRGFLKVITPVSITIPEGQSGRLQLANWLTETEHGAGHLAARVIANRAWHHLMGRGIVRTVDNFGRTGEPPTHPELLDSLARTLIDSNWSLKQLIREIVLSETFAMSSEHNPAAHERDPENKWLWRANRIRLSPEAIRDSMLHISGQLELKPVDSTVAYLGDQATAVGKNENRRKTDYLCRSVYLPVIRNDLPEIFQAFDFADPHVCTGMRPKTMVATQGLFMLNDPSVMDAANATAERLISTHPDASDSEFADAMYALLFQQPPTESERGELVEFFQSIEQQLQKEKAEVSKARVLSIACHAMFASTRFQILD
ncbi:MAG: DUF1553 domain-containing protein [Planctomycetaceae bacterium]|nr:DUF1553 domain-containing protein [Planctomycetaceae bacterium]